MAKPTLRDFVRAVEKKTAYPITEERARSWAEADLIKCWRDPLKPDSGWWYPQPKHLDAFMRDTMDLDDEDRREVLKEMGLNFTQLELPLHIVSTDRRSAITA